jgi:hypothetical protein
MISRPSHVNLLVETAMTKYRPESRTSGPSVTVDFSAKSTSLNLSSLCDRGGYRPGLWKGHWHCGLVLLIAFDRFTLVKASINNIVEVLFAGVLNGRATQAKASSL